MNQPREVVIVGAGRGRGGYGGASSSECYTGYPGR